MEYRVDDLDRKIIECLQESGRLSNTQIAGRLGVTESTVRKRIDRLLDHEVIRITAVANPLLLDYPIVAILGIHASPQKMEDVARGLDGFPEFRFIGLTTGVYDFIAEAWFRSLGDLRQFLTERLLKLEGVTRVDTAHVLQMIRYTYDWGVDRAQKASQGTTRNNDGNTEVLPLSSRRREQTVPTEARSRGTGGEAGSAQAGSRSSGHRSNHRGWIDPTSSSSTWRQRWKVTSSCEAGD